MVRSTELEGAELSLFCASSSLIIIQRGFLARQLFVILPPITRLFCAELSFTRVMEQGLWRVALALVLVSCAYFPATDAASEACPRPSAGDLILHPSATCFPSDAPAARSGFRRVFEYVILREKGFPFLDEMEINFGDNRQFVYATSSRRLPDRVELQLILKSSAFTDDFGDEITFQKTLRIVHKNKEQYVAVLFYSSWCPFSKICRSSFSSMPSLFPAIPHFAFEESVIRPSILSRHGVHGFPTLFLLNSTMRVRYHGPRTISNLAMFYSDVTGVTPTETDLTIFEQLTSATNLVDDTWGNKQEDYLFSWAISCHNFPQQDVYLALASSFVLLRLLYFVLPKLSSFIRKAWGRQMQFPNLISLCECSQAFLEQVAVGFSRLTPGKRANLQEGAMNAKAWVSKSLVSVSVGEPSSERVASHQ